MFCEFRTARTTAATLPRVTRRRAAFAAMGLVGMLAASFGLYASTGVLGDNVREVVPGKLYRSAQLSIPMLDRVVGEHHIASVLSLRKVDPPAPELAREQERLDELGIAHDNVALSPQKLPRPEALAQLLGRFDVGPYPMLVHCEEGADRTGLATVIWLVTYGGRTLAEARASDLSWRNGHFAFGQAHAMDDFLDLYERTSHGADLRSWILATYPRLYDSRSHPHARNELLAHDRG